LPTNRTSKSTNVSRPRLNVLELATKLGDRRSLPPFILQKSSLLLSIFSLRDDYRMNIEEMNAPAHKAVLLDRRPFQEKTMPQYLVAGYTPNDFDRPK
jgi:hypothetical protein